MQVFDDAEGAVDVAAGFHVDLDAGADGACLQQDGLDIGAAEGVVDVESELGELDGNGGGQAGGGDGIESLLDAGAGSRGLFLRSHVFAEVIEGSKDVLGLETAGDGDDILEALSGDEAAGEAGGGRRGFHPPAEGAVAGEEEKRFSQHTWLIPSHGT